MQVSEFKGIQQFHDGMAVSDYCNVIPLGNSAIDRQGEEVVDDWPTNNRPTYERVCGTFVDSKRNIYIACTDGLRMYRVDIAPNGDQTPHFVKMLDIGVIYGEVTFCESSTKPSQVYCCVNGRVYYWNTEQILGSDVPEEYAYRCEAFTPVRVPVIAGPDALVNPDAATKGWFPEVNHDNYYLHDESKCPMISKITWFDNRLVMVQSSKNTVWLTEVDPSRFLVCQKGESKPARTILGINPNAEGLNDKYINDFMPHYYASTASSANLVDAVAFTGQLYFLNDYSIEVWSATGNYLNPIQHNSQNTLYYGGRSPVIVADTMYLICRDTIHNDFIAAIKQNGQFEHISNIEIERQLQPGAHIMKPLSVRDQSMFVVYRDDDMVEGFSATEGRWWKYQNGQWKHDFMVWTICNIQGQVYGVSRWGYLIRATDKHRKFSDGNPITRYIRGAFVSFIGRKILRDVEIICDTGVYFGDNFDRKAMYLRVSFDRGLSFGPYLYRKLGAAGKNDRQIIWRNCGSGNSILLEFGTADNVRFQIYGINFDLA